jgi:2',3'-cyclic-nucleotide 2'-phosphodiesterase (5'-nucleotidase family)
VVLSVPGSVLREALEYGLGRRVTAGQSGAMPHVSGLRLVYAPALPDGRRIVSIAVGGEPLDPDRRYRLTISAYLAGGGDGYTMLKGQPILRAAESAPIETEVAIEAVRAAGVVMPTVDGRLQVQP